MCVPPSIDIQNVASDLCWWMQRRLAANSNSILRGNNVTLSNGRPQQLGLGDIAQGGLGNGVGEAGDMVSKYLIECAEQYQPVIEMPTGVDVEIVFLEGVYVRN